MISIILNGQNQQFDDHTTIHHLLEKLGLSEKRLAIEINQQIIPRSEFTSFSLSENDHIEIVQAIGGGSL